MVTLKQFSLYNVTVEDINEYLAAEAKAGRVLLSKDIVKGESLNVFLWTGERSDPPLRGEAVDF